MEARNFVDDDVLNNRLTANINVDMQDLVPTSQTCACLIIEILKVLLYEKCQIPYPYFWLQSALAKRKPEPNIHSHKESVIINKYFNLASNAHKCLEEIIFNINAIMKSNCCNVQEVAILFGATPYTPKEVFSIKFPPCSREQADLGPKSTTHRKLQSIFKSVFLSEEWLKAVQHQIQTTNTFVMIKKIGVLRHDDEYFEHYVNFSVPASVRNTIITLTYDEKQRAENLLMFSPQSLRNTIQAIQARSVEWYQARGVVKGFPDFFIDKVSVSELW